MCGIAGIFAFNETGKAFFPKIREANLMLNRRGPDHSGFYEHGPVSLTHARLSIIDVSAEGNQPRVDELGRYVIVFNGEIFNFKTSRKSLEDEGVKFFSTSDTEVLLKSYIKWGTDIFKELNGFFSFAIYDKQEQSLVICRDRYGIKPLFWHIDEDKICFASELKALYALGIPKELDYNSLLQYLHLNYIAAPNTIIKGIEKFPIANWVKIDIANKVSAPTSYYQIKQEVASGKKALTYENASKQLVNLLDDAVNLRMEADVPLGAFLSGGIDSSVIVALASSKTKDLNTFSIGYKDEPFYDETSYAKLVADKYKTNHTVFSLSNDDLLEHLFSALDYFDEPFADSSALAVNILCKLTRQKVKVALSGDGADEIFAGYNKYMAEYKIRQNNITGKTVAALHPLWKAMPKSRNNPIFNLFRQLDRYAEGHNLSYKDRYYRWAGFAGDKKSMDLLSAKSQQQLVKEQITSRKNAITSPIEGKTITEVLRADMDLVLQNDMLVKVDMMSMGNSLEVRVPFLDYRVVDFAFSLPDSFKINESLKKRIVQDAFRHLLPKELYNRPKHGFEVPLLNWFRNELRSFIEDDLLENNFIAEQGIFNVEEIKKLKQKLFSSNPEDSHARIWGLIVFQYWYKKYFI